MEEPKILQVTYGAFSCTLEGFEDPVETLMAVAEYFRGLAADNPGFAGVGGVPDAAEMARQVRAAGAGSVEVRVEAAAPEAENPPAAGATGQDVAAPVAEDARQGPDPANGQIVAAGGLDLEASGGDRAAGGMLLAADGGAGATRLALGLASLRRARLAEESEPDASAPGGAEEVRARSEKEPSPAVPDTEGAGPAQPEAKPVMAAPEPEAMPVSAVREQEAATAVAGREQDTTPAVSESEVTPAVEEPEVVPVSANGRSHDEDEEEPEGSDRPSPSEVSSEARRLLSTSPDEDALLRILSRAESQLSDPEAARRREALAHVKAAVAATQAGRALGDVPSAAEDLAPFREDFEAVARPPVAEERPATPPLRLVASQRVDLPRMKAALAGRQSHAVRERPVAEPPAPPAARAEPMPARTPAPDGGSFADFAAGAGASALPELLEAAAAWLVREGDEGEACRTRLLELAGEIAGREPSREEALRVFGTLLREGRLERAGNGRFRPGPLSRLDPPRLAG